MTGDAHGPGAPLDRALAKIFRRIIPLLFVCYVLAYLDRINFGFAALSMNGEIHVSMAAFGLAGTIFYGTYMCAEIPSNMLMVRFGARRWIARIMVTWGLASMATAAVNNAEGLYIARGLLGLAEAGFVPGIMLYLTYWIPAAKRGRAMALFMIAQPTAIALGSPISGFIMEKLDGFMSLSGWRWLFLVEGFPTVLMGIVVLFFLLDKPHDAAWLTRDERDALNLALNDEPDLGHGTAKSGGWAALASPKFVLLCLSYFLLVASLSTLGTWSPLILQDIFGKEGSLLMVGAVAALPGLFAVILMPLIASSSDRRQERVLHFTFTALASALGWYLSSRSGQPALQVLGLVLATSAGFSSMPVLWTIAPSMLPAPTRPIGIAVVATVGIAGSIVSPMANGWLRETTGGFSATSLLGAGWMVGSAMLVLALRNFASPATTR